MTTDYGKEAAGKADAIDEAELQRIGREFIANALGGPDTEVA